MVLLWGGRWKTRCCVRRLKDEELLAGVDLEIGDRRGVGSDGFRREVAQPQLFLQSFA